MDTVHPHHTLTTKLIRRDTHGPIHSHHDDGSVSAQSLFARRAFSTSIAKLVGIGGNDVFGMLGHLLPKQLEKAGDHRIVFFR